MKIVVRWFKYDNLIEFKKYLINAVIKNGAHIKEVAQTDGQGDLWVSQGNGYCGVRFKPSLNIYSIFDVLSIELSCISIEVRIQESNHWDYCLYSANTQIDKFSADPEYFDEDTGIVSGNAALLSKSLQLEETKIQQYIVRWSNKLMGSKAYENDEYEYGDYNQMFDFVKAINAIIPLHPTYHIVK